VSNHAVSGYWTRSASAPWPGVTRLLTIHFIGQA
jgi:hypothetical protein